MLCHIVIALIITFCDAAPHPPGHHYYKTHHQPMWRYVKPFTAFTWNKPKMAQPEVPVARAASKDVVDVAVGAGAFTTLVKIVSDLGLVDTLKGAEALTVFAPSDDAFAKLPAGTLESLTPDQAKEIVLRHVVTAKVPAAAVATGPVETIGGEVIDLIKTEAGGVQIAYEGNTINVVTADVMASNGVIHIIDKVILPATAGPVEKEALGDVVDIAVGAGAFTTLVKIVSDLELVDTLKGAEALTVFAPSDDAFAKLPAGTLESLTPAQAKEIVLRHVVTAKVPAADVATGPVETIGGEVIDLIKTEAGGVQIGYEGNTINVVTADVMASNGVIHIIDKVILPATAGPVEKEALGDVVDVAVGAGAFTTLVKIVSDLGLVDTLKGAEALTVFAPSDEAFAKLPAGTLESLTPDQAKTIVLRHVVTAKVPAAAVTTGPVGTIGGEVIDLVKTPEGGVQINYNGNTQNVVTADVMASNGVIHVIDSVIL